MTSASPKKQRCAIYTRVSTDSGLEQEFNSLDAQREASEAFIRSQINGGWQLIKNPYDDGGFSGGSLDRPALQQLLADIRAGLVDIVLVYKVDRLTRSLADFAKLIELFDQHETSFVSVTQAFNTTTSMGRLTLNVLLSFAQFEREVTAERIRDKIAASKKKGIWMGGNVPLGYRVESRKLLVEPTEAETVRMIFRRYLDVGSMLPLLTELHQKGITTRRRVLSNGKAVGNVPFTRGPLDHLLKNRTYIGEINHRGKSYPGEHLPIVEKHIFDAVQAKLSTNRQVARNLRTANGALLAGKIFDDRGNRMTPSFSVKKGVRYRYYDCRLLIEGRKSEAGTISRVSAPVVEAHVLKALAELTGTQPNEAAGCNVESRTEFLDKLVGQVSIHDGVIRIKLTPDAAASFNRPVVDIAWQRPCPRPKRDILLPHADPTKDGRPIRAEVRSSVVQAVALGRSWLQQLISGEAKDTEVIAEREDRSKRSVHMMISLAFVAPDIVEALIAGRLPRGIGITRLTDLPLEWAKQRQVLGLSNRSLHRRPPEPRKPIPEA